MPIPKFQSIMLPILKMADNQNEHHRRIVLNVLASQFSLTDEEREEVTDKKKQNLFDNRCDFALGFLRKNGLIQSTGWGSFRITERGLNVLKVFKQSPGEIEDAFSKSQDKIVDYLNERCPFESEDDNNHTSDESTEGADDNDQTPEELIKENYQKSQKELASELLQKIKENKPTFFEELVIDLLVAMGYGGSRADAEAVGRSGDGGIDGVINEDRLGLDVIYVQAKRWEGKVGTRPVRDFVGALQGKRARKGIFITTSGFSSGVQEYISAIDSRDSKVILINGNQLAQYMIEHNVGVSITETYEIKRVDSDYFAENTE